MANSAVDDSSEYQVVSRGSVFCSSVRAIREKSRTAQRGADRETETEDRQLVRIGADGQGEPEKRGDGCETTCPAKPFNAEYCSNNSGQQRINEISQHPDGHGDEIDRLEQPIDDGGEQHAEDKSYDARSRCSRQRRRTYAQITEQNSDPDNAADQRQREQADPRIQGNLGKGVADAE